MAATKTTVPKTSLSVGEIIAAMLNGSEAVKERTNKIYPVVVDNAKLPYVAYRRTSLDKIPTKFGVGADTVAIEVLCFTEKYGEGVELAEAVREALDQKQGTNADGAMTMRSCVLSDADEAWQDDAFVQQLVFAVKC